MKALIVMAAGMGSRFGGLKQLQPVTPDGKTLVDFSAFDALRFGFEHIVFVVRQEILSEFKLCVGDRIAMHAHVDYALQTSELLPQGRTKPLGTGHALLCARPFVGNEPFAVINADDYYGANAFCGIARHLDAAKQGEYVMAAYRLKQTLSHNGAVSRGICRIENGKLKAIDEHTGIAPNGSLWLGGRHVVLSPNTPVSMNLWGFTSDFWVHLQQAFDEFLKNAQLNEDEFLIQTALTALIEKNEISVSVTEAPDKWCGFTHRADLDEVCKTMTALQRTPTYEKMW